MMISNHQAGFQRASLLIAALLLLTGCASLGKKECLSGDWASIGQSDGAKGKNSSERLLTHSKACNKHDVTLDENVYMGGYEEGLKTYCTTANGYTVGSKFAKNQYDKSGYASVCPTDTELDFLKGYVRGLQINLENKQKEVADLEVELRGEQTTALILDVLESSRAEGQDKKVDDTNADITKKRTAIVNIINEIEKWMVARPELRE